MKKTINVYTPQEKMPEYNTLLLIESCEQGTVMAYYVGNNIWENEDGSKVYYKTDDINWWLDLEKLNTSIELSLMNMAWKKNHPTHSQAKSMA